MLGRIMVESSLYWRKQFTDFLLKSWNKNFVAGAVFVEVGGWLLLLCALYWTFHVWQGAIIRVIFRGRRSIWWCWRMTPDAPRNVLDVSCETRINHQCHFAWQAQYLVKLEGDSCCSTHCTGRFMSDKDQSSESFFVAGGVFGDVGGWLLMLCAMYWTFHVRQGSMIRVIFRGRPNIWWSWVSLVQHFVKFWEIAGARNLVFFYAKCVAKMGHYLTSRHLTTNHITSSHLAAKRMTSRTTSLHITSESPPPTHHGNTTGRHQTERPLGVAHAHKKFGLGIALVGLLARIL